MSFQNKLFKYESKLNNLQKWGLPLIYAIRANNLEEVRKLLTINPAIINERWIDYLGQTPIFFATSVEMLRLLIEFGADINIINKTGYTLLMSLSANDMHELVLFLVNYGADISITIKREYGININIFDYYIHMSKHNLPYTYFRGTRVRNYYAKYDPIITTIYKLLLNKGAKFNNIIDFDDFNLIPTHDPTNITEVADINKLNLLKKNNMVLPALVAQPEAFNIDYVRVGHPTVKYYQYLKEAYNITEAEILAMATEMALERRMPAALSRRRYLEEESRRFAHATAAASAPPSSPSAPANAGAGNL